MAKDNCSVVCFADTGVACELGIVRLGESFVLTGITIDDEEEIVLSELDPDVSPAVSQRELLSVLVLARKECEQFRNLEIPSLDRESQMINWLPLSSGNETIHHIRAQRRVAEQVGAAEAVSYLSDAVTAGGKSGFRFAKDLNILDRERVWQLLQPGSNVSARMSLATLGRLFLSLLVDRPTVNVFAGMVKNAAFAKTIQRVLDLWEGVSVQESRSIQSTEETFRAPALAVVAASDAYRTPEGMNWLAHYDECVRRLLAQADG